MPQERKSPKFEDRKLVERRVREEKVYKADDGKVYREVHLKVEILPDEIRGEIFLLRKKVKERGDELANLKDQLKDYENVAAQLSIDVDAEPTFQP